MKAATAKKTEQQTAAPQSITIPQLAEGEHYAGIIIQDGKISHHLVLLPGDSDPATWSKAKTFAKNAGGELPTRSEQALLFANLKEQFQSSWYWSSEQCAPHDACAWSQYFSYGSQDVGHEDNDCRVRAVRRLPI